MSATPLVTFKRVNPDGTLIDIKIWRLPMASLERPHGLKYSLFYGRSGERIVGYDNETGKGDHRHYRDCEKAYVFVSLEQMFRDFFDDVARERGEQ
jgi:Family of unknown function (DUF6516)